MEQGKYKMTLEHLVVPESKEALEKKWWAHVKATQEPIWKSSQCLEQEQYEQQNNLVFDYYPKQNKNINESMLI